MIGAGPGPRSTESRAEKERLSNAEIPERLVGFLGGSMSGVAPHAAAGAGQVVAGSRSDWASVLYAVRLSHAAARTGASAAPRSTAFQQAFGSGGFDLEKGPGLHMSVNLEYAGFEGGCELAFRWGVLGCIGHSERVCKVRGCEAIFEMLRW